MSNIKEPVWAFIDNGVVTNTVVIFDLAVVEEHKQRHDDVIRIDDLLPVPGKNWFWDKKYGFRRPKPYPSWVWNDKERNWDAPVATPAQDDEENPKPYEWDEENLQWVVPEWWLDEQAKQDETGEIG